MSKGIDYGLGQANIDDVTGIRYGVISQNSVGQAWYDDAEPQYGEPTCPNCGDRILGSTEDQIAEYHCSNCDDDYCSEDCYPEDPIGYTYDSEGYELGDCLNSDIMVIASPYYTHCRFCSPCVPGAGDLDNPDLDGVKAYCLGHDWFDGGKAPYPVFRVVDSEEVIPKSR